MNADTLVQVLGSIMLIAGLAIRYFINRNRFNRRNGMGVEIFRNYEHATAIRGLERIGKIIGLLLILAGLFFFWVGWFNKQPSKSLLPKSPVEQQHPK